MRNGYIIVEGPHDLAFFVRILRKRFGFEEVKLFNQLPEFGRPLVPRSFPANIEGDIQARVEVPTFLSSAEWNLVVQCAEGDSKIVPQCKRTITALKNHDYFLDAIGYVIDCDDRAPEDRFGKLERALKAESLPVPNGLGEVYDGPPRVSALVLPDNHAKGTLEDLMLVCGAHAYPELTALAFAHVDGARDAMTRISKKEGKPFHKPSGMNKARVSTVANLLKPGKAVQVSIQDNAWITAETMALPALQPAVSFLRDLLELEAS